MSSQPGPVLEVLGRLAFEATKVRPLLPTYAHLLVSALFPIYTAAHASLARPKSAAPPERRHRDGATSYEVNDEVVNKLEGLSASDAVVFPLLAGATLSSLYFLIKWLEDPEWLNWCLGIYFAGVGTVFAMKFLKDALCLMRSFVFPLQYSAHGLLWKTTPVKHYYRAYLSPVKPSVLREDSPCPGIFRKVPFSRRLRKLGWGLQEALYAKARLRVHIYRLLSVKSSIDILDVISFTIAVSLSAYNTLVDKPWYLTNFFGFSFCYGTLQLMSPTTGLTGTMVLVALFFYDIYFVFFTPMMVTVATKLDVPIKLLFPRSDGCVLPVGAVDGSEAMEAYKECLAKKRTMAMLGLGDIVIPGMMLAFALRFDLFLFYLNKQSTKTGQVEGGSTKAEYMQATGGWGERFWTINKHLSPTLRARQFPKVYFTATMVGYLAGMVTTLVVMQVSQHAQPALLYLVPGVLLSLWGTAFVRGDLMLLWQYSEAADEESGNKENSKKMVESDKVSKPKIQANGHADTASNNVAAKQSDTVQKASGTLDVNGDSTRPEIGQNVSIKAATKRHAETTSTDPDDDSKHIFLFSIYFGKSRQPAPSSTVPVDNISAATNEVDPKSVTDDISTTDTDSAAESSGPAKPLQNDKGNAQAEGSVDVLPDVAAHNAVLAKLRKEVGASSAGVVDGRGGEPPAKRTRKA